VRKNIKIGFVITTTLEERSTRLELLGDHTCGREHGEAAGLELLRLHLLELLGVLGLRAERVEVGKETKNCIKNFVES